MGGAPVIEWIRPGVGFTAPAATSFRRAESSWRNKTGRAQIDCNSSYRDYGVQLSMWQAWTAWTEGWGPKPNHSRALHPDVSVHCRGEALDSDDWTVPGFIAHMADHGWIRTAASDPSERHHFEYQWWRDNHRNDPAPAGDGTSSHSSEEDFMSALAPVQQAQVYDANVRHSPSGDYFMTDAIINDVRKYGDGVVARTDAANSRLEAIIAMIGTLAAPEHSADIAAFEQKLRESEERTRAELIASEERTAAEVRQIIEGSTATLRAEIVATLSEVDGIDADQVTQAVDAALDRVFVRHTG